MNKNEMIYYLFISKPFGMGNKGGSQKSKHIGDRDGIWSGQRRTCTSTQGFARQPQTQKRHVLDDCGKKGRGRKKEKRFKDEI